MTEEEKEFYKSVQRRTGQKGGRSTKKKYGLQHYKNMAKKRWEKK